jgi:hypothetical protein
MRFFSISQAVSELEERVQLGLGEVRRLKMEMEVAERKNDETVRGLQNDNKNLKEVNEVCQTQLQEVTLESISIGASEKRL